MKIKTKDFKASLVADLLVSFNRDECYSPKMKSVKNKFQALTIKNHLIKLLNKDNNQFIESKQKVEKIILEARKEVDRVMKEQQARLTQLPIGSRKETIEKLQEEIQGEYKKIVDEQKDITQKRVDRLGYKLGSAGDKNRNILFLLYKDETKAKDLDIELNDKHNQVEYLLEFFDQIVFPTNSELADDIVLEISDVYEALKTQKA